MTHGHFIEQYANMTHGHFIEQYECGHRGVSCHCPVENKEIRGIPGMCPECIGRKAQEAFAHHTLGPWNQPDAPSASTMVEDLSRTGKLREAQLALERVLLQLEYAKKMLERASG